MTAPGWRFASFRCAYDDAEIALAVLERFPCVADSPPPSYADGAIRYRIELARLPTGDGPAMHLRITTALEKACSLHRMPSSVPPPKDAA